MKKCLLGLLFVPISVFAISSPKLLTLDTEINSNQINYSGTTEGEVYAVMCKLYDGDTVIDMLSSPVYDNKFSDGFEISKSGNYKVLCANYDGGEYITKEINVNEEKYTLELDDVIISFQDTSGHEYNLTLIEFLTADKEFLENNGITEEEYQEGLKKIKESLKNDGTLLGVYGIEVTDEFEISKTNGEFNFKIKMTDEMKKYNSFKLININDDFEKGDVVELTIDGDYLVGTLPHLSIYALVGEVKENVTSNPKTGDSIIKYVSILGVSGLGTCLSFRYVKKSKKN